MKVVSDTTKTVKYRTRKLKVRDYTITESYTDGVLTAQAWSVKGGFKTTHPGAYEPRSMHFAYYENVDFLESESCCNVRDSDIEEARYQTSFIEDWENFDAFDQVLCFYIGMDGNIYRINSPDPIPLWRRKDYIGSFANDEYSLPEVVKVLEKRKWIKNIEIIDIPYYNQEEGKTRAIEFEYKLPSKKDLGKKLSKNKLFANHYFG